MYVVDGLNLFLVLASEPLGRGDPFGGSGAGNGADAAHHGGGATATGAGAGGWDKNFANFDDNI